MARVGTTQGSRLEDPQTAAYREEAVNTCHNTLEDRETRASHLRARQDGLPDLLFWHVKGQRTTYAWKILEQLHSERKLLAKMPDRD